MFIKGKTKQLKKLLVTGHPRTGTKYMALLLQAFGLDVRHECMGADGISSWMFAANTDLVPFSTDNTARQPYNFLYTIHVVRHPIKTIASVVFTETASTSSLYRNKFITIQPDLPTPAQALQSYLGWNKLIKAQAPDFVVQVEQAAEAIPEFIKKTCGVSGKQVGPLPSIDTNARPHLDLEWADMQEAIPEWLKFELCAFCKEYGYSIPGLV